MAMKEGSSKEDEEDVDFMSDAFVDESKNNVRPGLMFKRRERRLHEMQKKKHQCDSKPVKVLEKERREEALNQPLNASNKGFRMLQKMGFQSHCESSKNREPIPIVLKEDRQCLGMNSIINERNAFKRKESELISTDFRKRMKNKFSESISTKDLISLQKACFQLDGGARLVEPLQAWFWPKNARKNKEQKEDDDNVEEDNEEEDELSNEEKLDLLNSYLRSKYFYCIWCGIKYETTEEMSSHCPGKTRDDHDL